MSRNGTLILQSGVVAALIAFLGNLWVNHQTNKAELLLENRRHDAQLILNAIDPHDVGKSREMLTFILDAGLLYDPGELKNLLNEPGNLPTSRGAIACYTHPPVGSVNGGYQVVGFIEDVPGHYEGRIFKPKGFEEIDLSKSPHFKRNCHEKFPNVCPGEESCWAGGDTGGYYGFEQGEQ